MQGAKPETEAPTPTLRKASLLTDAKSAIFDFKHTIVSGFDNFRSQVGVDGILFREFQDSIRIIKEASNQPQTQAFSTIMSAPFVKRCMIEDVDPTIGHLYTVGSSQSQSFRKKIVDFISKGQMEIKLFLPPQDVAERLSAPSKQSDDGLKPVTTVKSYAVKEKCYVCSIQRDCEYQIRLGPPEKQTTKPDWTMLCRFCRDKLISVMDYFAFLAYLAHGHGKSDTTILGMFRQTMWFRRRIHLARVGSCSIFETELTAVNGCTTDADSDRYITIIS
jgi:hypothetical protein